MKLIINEAYEYPVNTMVFNGGEVNVNILKDNKQLRKFSSISTIALMTQLRNAEDIMELILTKDAVDRFCAPRLSQPQIDLVIHYLPYARQDRVCNKGEAHSLVAFTKLVNGMNFDTVVVADCHSPVGTALLNNCTELTQKDIIYGCPDLTNKLRSGAYTLVSPDAGAEKKTLELAKEFNCKMIRATKTRDVATGKIINIGFVDPIPELTNFLIVDDICDGGGTFFPLAEELTTSLNKIELYVTHGIFSKGISGLLEKFDTIYTTDSFWKGSTTDKIKVIKL